MASFSTRVKNLFRERYLYIGLGSIAGVLLLAYVLVDFLVMPAYTRHDAEIQVPDVSGMSYDAAAAALDRTDLRPVRVVKRFDDAFEADAVLEQSPAANSAVKPNRQIYLTVNSGRQAMVAVPDLAELSLRQARNRVASSQLALGEVLQDTVPSPYQNTVTRQTPAPGDSVLPGSPVSVWVSTGLGSQRVAVPDIVGMHVDAAEQELLRARLRLLLLDDASISPAAEDTVQRQSPQPGTLVPEGSEIRGFARTSEDGSEGSGNE